MTAYPAARQRPCSNHSGPMGAHLGLVLHVQEGNNDLAGEFNNRTAQASYTFVAYADGGLDQFVDADAIAWAQAQGNGTYNSVGTQGFANESLTEACCQTIAALYRWGHDTYGWPYTLAEAPGEPGLGWHGMGDSNGHTGWGGHPACPGDLRKAQRQHILDLAQGGANQGGTLSAEEVAALESHLDASVTAATRNIDQTVQDTRTDLLNALNQSLALLQRVVDKLGA
ncbi:MAG: hypothetical protein QOK39_120 [Acidimicrobiaceae bacterium]|nr:hypothetical protein [Acidimicrobiaceae bacterium]